MLTRRRTSKPILFGLFGGGYSYAYDDESGKEVFRTAKHKTRIDALKALALMAFDRGYTWHIENIRLPYPGYYLKKFYDIVTNRGSILTHTRPNAGKFQDDLGNTIFEEDVVLFRFSKDDRTQ